MANNFGWDKTKKLLRDKIQSGAVSYAADAGSNDSYAITLDPIPTAYTTGMVVNFYANTANTTGATLNINGLGAKNILKNHDQALSTGDIEAGQIVTVVYDGTQFQMQSQTGAMNFASVDIDGGTIDGTTVGKSDPRELWGSPVVSKGPAIITTFAGTVTATASTTVTFSSAADAILAGYSATNPILGTTLISNALTRYIVSWTNATTAVVDASVTWAGTAITSVQLPIATFVNSAGVTQGWMNAAGVIVFRSGSVFVGNGTDVSQIILVGQGSGVTPTDGVAMSLSGAGSPDDMTFNFVQFENRDIDFYTNYASGGDNTIPRLRVSRSGNILTGGLTAAGTSAAKVLVMGSGTAPTTSPADAAQIWVADQNGAGTATAYMRNEAGQAGVIAHQAPLTNLLTNSQWMAMSGSGLTQGRTVARQTDFEVGSAIYTNDGTGTTGWSSFRCAISSAGGELVITDDGSGADMGIYRALSGLTVGRLYKLSVKLTNGTGTWVSPGEVTIYNNAVGVLLARIGTQTEASQQDYSLIWEATETNNVIRFVADVAAGETVKIDTIDVYEVTPGYVAADTLGPDGWYKQTTLQIAREHTGTNTKDGSFYALKLTPTAADDFVKWPISDTFKATQAHYKKFVGRTVTLGVWAKTSTASHVRVGTFDDIAGSWSGYHTGGGGWEWIEVTYSVPTNATFFGVTLGLHQSSGTAYFSQPMLAFSSSLGAGNYQPIPNEVIRFANAVTSNLLNNKTGANGFSDVAQTLLGTEADSNGVIGKGARGIGTMALINDSGSATATQNRLLLSDNTGTAYGMSISCAGVAADAQIYGTGWTPTTTGDIMYFIDATGSNTFDVQQFVYTAIQTQ